MLQKKSESELSIKNVKTFVTYVAAFMTFLFSIAAVGRVALWLGFDLGRFEWYFATIHGCGRFIVDIGVYSWLSWIVEFFWSCCLLLTGEIRWPELIIPNWIRELSLWSLLFWYVFALVDIFFPREEREEKYAQQSKDDDSEIREKQGRIGNFVHEICLHKPYVWLLGVRDRITSYLHDLLRGRIPQKGIDFVMRSVFAIVFFLGIWRFLGYCVNIGLAGRLDNPKMNCRKRTFKIFWICLASSTLVVVIICVWVWIENESGGPPALF